MQEYFLVIRYRFNDKTEIKYEYQQGRSAREVAEYHFNRYKGGLSPYTQIAVYACAEDWARGKGSLVIYTGDR